MFLIKCGCTDLPENHAVWFGFWCGIRWICACYWGMMGRKLFSYCDKSCHDLLKLKLNTLFMSYHGQFSYHDHQVIVTLFVGSYHIISVFFTMWSSETFHNYILIFQASTEMVFIMIVALGGRSGKRFELLTRNNISYSYITNLGKQIYGYKPI